jgi:protein tyrosine/serine phosphatase
MLLWPLQEPCTEIPGDVFERALCEVMDIRNHPLLIHCNKGKHRTGCLVGCFRKIQQWYVLNSIQPSSDSYPVILYH